MHGFGPPSRTGKLGLSLYFLLAALITEAQIPVGSWRDHLPYGHGKQLAEFDGRIFCASSDGSLFSCNIKDKTIKKYSKVNGLSDADVSTIGSSSETKTFFIGYSNGNIDLIRNDSIINIPDIAHKTIMGEKAINRVYFRERFAYLACSFGIVVCDLLKKEIKDTYFFGPLGSQIQVNDITSDGIYLYAATDKGIYKVNLKNANLLDYNAWTHIEELPDPNANYDFVVSYNNYLYTVYSNTSLDHDDIIKFNDAAWEVWSNSYADEFYYLKAQDGALKLSSSNRSKIYNSQEQLITDLVTYYSREILIDSKQGLWYAASYGGLVSMDYQGNNGALHVPDGPEFRDVNEIKIASGNIWIAAGTYNSRWLGYGAFSFIDEKWTQFNSNKIPEMKDFLNIAKLAIDPLDTKHVLGGSNGFGIAEFQDGVLLGIEDEKDGILKPVAGYEHIPGYLNVSGICFDQKGNVYATVSNSEVGVYKKVQGGNWSAVDLEYDEFNYNVGTGEILAASNGQIWLCLINKGILVFTEDGGASTQERFFTVKNQEGDIFDKITCIAEDKDGSIWVGTNKGPVVYSNTENIFDVDQVVGYQPVIPRNDGTSYGSLVLASENINDIEVDGANRKWFATEKSGAFLLSDDAKKEIQHFTAEASPLFSDNVITIGTNDVTGEVFFGTEKGILSYRGNATEGNGDFSHAYVFPNPVRETYTGKISLTGLVSDVNVKITDISGNLVYETTALGGNATWDGRNFRGDRVHTGVYLIFCTNEDGTKTFVTKLLFIH